MKLFHLSLGAAAALGVVGVALAGAPSQPPPPPDSTALELVGEVLRVLQALHVIPAWGLVLAAVLVAVAAVLLRHLGLGALLARGWRYLRSIPTTGAVEQGDSPPIDMPPGGAPNPPPGDLWKDGNP